MKKLLLIVFVLCWHLNGLAQSEYMKTSFEEVPIVPGVNDANYIDTADPNTPHQLINNTGQTPVNVTATGSPPLSYSASYVPYDSPGLGLTDGDQVGVTNSTTVVGAFTDGAQGYSLSDTDGTMILTFSEFLVGGLGDIVLTLDYFVQETDWEYSDGSNSSGNDLIRIWVKNLVTDEELDLLNSAGSDIDDLGIEGSWNTLEATLWDANKSQLYVEFRSNSATESLFIDNVLLTVDSTIGVPENTKNNFSIYPNPTMGDVINIVSATNQSKTVVVYDIIGQRVLKTNITNSKMNISSLSPGVYMLKITENDYTATKKLIVR